MGKEVKLSDVGEIPEKRGVKWPQVFRSLRPGESKKVENFSAAAARSALRYHQRKGRFLDVEVVRRGNEAFLHCKPRAQ